MDLSSGVDSHAADARQNPTTIVDWKVAKVKRVMKWFTSLW
jgi:hypothetical protein